MTWSNVTQPFFGASIYPYLKTYDVCHKMIRRKDFWKAETLISQDD